MPTTESRSVDPTRTSVLRKRYRQHYRRMWRRVNAAINEYIDTVDFSRPLAQRTVEFNRFLGALLQQEFGRTESDRERGVRAMIYTLAQARGLIPAHPRCRCRWRRLPANTERSQGRTVSATSSKYGEWRVPQEIDPDPHLRLYTGGGRKPVKSK